jgi:hypothetical protein
MPLKLKSTGGGDVTLDVPSTASSLTATVPAQTGTLSMMQLMTAQTASGSSVDFTDIPSWVKRITVILNGVSFAAAGFARFRIGTSSGIVTTGYSTQTNSITTTPAITSSSVTDGLGFLSTGAAAGTNTGRMVIENITGNTWVSSSMVSRPADSFLLFSTGSITLGGTLDRFSLVATTSTFDAGTVNVLYEG